MVFSSLTFLCCFLPCALLLYAAAPKRLKNAAILAASLVFYAWGEPKFVLVMLFTIAQGYIFGLLIEKSEGRRAKIYLAVSSFISLGMLGYCKYANFFIENFNSVTGLSVSLLKVTLPVGISFYTFQIISYLADVYRRQVCAQRNFINLAAYIAMFPQLIAGPIVRYSDIARQLSSRTHGFEKAAEGTTRFILGLGKKVLIANTLGELCDIFRNSDDKSVLFFWLYAVAYTLHIYFDFSGYSDMAIGLGKLFGFDFAENFNYPYISRSLTEFWRRWHISLGSWFRDYVYIPLGGNRVSKLKWLRNIMVVWLLTGFWHGAAWNFIVWGLFFGVMLIAEKLFIGRFLEKAKVLNHIYVLLAVVLSFAVFDAADMAGAFRCIAAMFGAGSYPLVSETALYYAKSYFVILLAAAVGSTPIVSAAVKRIEKSDAGKKAFCFVQPVFLVALLCAVVGYLADGSFNPFLYFRF